VAAHLARWVLEYGYAGVFIVVALESLMLPVPGETVLVTAAIYAGRTHHLSLLALVVTAAVAVIVGGGAGFVLGRMGGYRLLRRYHRYLHLDEPQLRLGQYLFQQYGGRVVFFGRFIALLRAIAAFLAGVNCMTTSRFFLFHVAGAVAWAALFGLAGYALGDRLEQFSGTLALTVGAATIAAVGAAFYFVHHNFRRLQREADRTIGQLPA
jgi:membrane protein DedA with SNARE-associated domain